MSCEACYNHYLVLKVFDSLGPFSQISMSTVNKDSFIFFLSNVHNLHFLFWNTDFFTISSTMLSRTTKTNIAYLDLARKYCFNFTNTLLAVCFLLCSLPSWESCVLLVAFWIFLLFGGGHEWMLGFFQSTFFCAN